MENFTLNLRQVIIIFLLVVASLTSQAQYTKLVDFDGTLKGSFPVGSLTLSGSTLYGMTNNGGISGYGIIFKMNTDGSGFVKLLDFTGANNGIGPTASLTLLDNVLYGTTYSGGANNKGVAFKINTDGTGFVKLVDFDGVNKGGYPSGSLVLSDHVLYGMTELGGVNNEGVIFKVNTDGSEFTKLMDFNRSNHGAAIPYGSLTLSGNVLYGLTSEGGLHNVGVVFKLNTDGTGFTSLFDSFDGANSGSYPLGALTIDGNVLYATTSEGGSSSGEGIVFKLNTDGSGFTKVVAFDDTVHKGKSPEASLTLLGNVLYGTTALGGANHKGVIFKVNTDGSGFEDLLDFDGMNNGSTPIGDLTLGDHVLYGLAGLGGANKKGVIFRYDFTTTGITDNKDAGFSIYPNPVNDLLQIKNTINITQVELLNMEGQVVLSAVFNSPEAFINTTNLSKGMYTVRLYDKNGNILTSKILKL